MIATTVGSPAKRSVFYFALIIVSTVLALVALLIPVLTDYRTPALEAGHVVTRDYRAPQSVSFESEVLTEARRESAARTVSPIYTSPDTSVARQRLEDLRAALAYISNVRSDPYASPGQKMGDLAALDGVDLSQETAGTILGLTETRWQSIQQEALTVLERAMTGVIRPENVQSTRDRLPAMVSLSLPETQAAIVAELAAAFVAPNSEYSESLTEAAREEARLGIEPVTRSFAPGQTIVLRGEVLDLEDIEALQEMGLAKPEQRWQDLVSAAALVVLLAVFIILYLRRKKEDYTREVRSLMLITLLFLFFLLAARLAIPARTVLPYVFPLAAFGLTIAALFGAEMAMVLSLPLAIMAAFSLPQALGLTLYYLIGSLFGILSLGQARRVISFFFAGAAVAVSSAVVVIVYHLPLPSTDLTGLATLIGAAFFSGMASASIAILFQFLSAQFLGMTTPIQLMDLTRPDHPLLQMLLRDAPGTYQHSLQVANLSEQAAESVGADPLLTRVGALYHDIGKALNPYYFIENQPPGLINPHESLEAEKSSKIIIRHVTDGIELGKQHRLPRRILAFIAEHHGDMLTRYQYIQAVKAADGDESMVDEEIFRYPGPRPTSRETAILMLADGSEARVRAERPANVDDLSGLVKDIIDKRVSLGQLDNTTLTLSDLNVIHESFTATLRGIYHPRVVYPKLESISQADVPTIPIMSKPSDVQVDVTVDAPKN